MTRRLLNLLLGAMRAFWRLSVTALFVGVAVVAVINGRTLLAERAADRPVPEPAPNAVVAVDQIRIQSGYDVVRRFSGQVEARQQTDLSFEQTGTVAEVLVREGDRVAAGQPVARLDTALLDAERRRLEAQRAALEARVELAERTNARQAELRARGFATEQRLDDTSLTLAQIAAEMSGVDASLSIVDVNLAKSELRAPFDGWIAARTLDVGALAAPGAPVATLLQDGTPRFRAGLDPDLAGALNIGDAVTVSLSGVARTARLAQLAPDLDPVTRARIAFFDVDGAAPAPRATGEVALHYTVDASGAWVPLTALRKGPRGTWTLLTVSDGIVTVEAAEILHLDAARAFVRGTFRDGAEFLPNGTHRVVPGQSVTTEGVIAWAR